MPNFAVRFHAGAAIARWTDPPTADRPSRLNPAPNHPHLRWRATVGAQVELRAVVDGVSAPLDADIEGLFLGWFAEYPGAHPPTVSVPAGQSSVRRFTPNAAGHYLYVLRRMGGGGYAVHLDAIGAP